MDYTVNARNYDEPQEEDERSELGVPYGFPQQMQCESESMQYEEDTVKLDPSPFLVI